MAFAFCDNLKSVTLGSNITSLGYSAFLGCTSLEQAVVDCSFDTLPTSTFEKCSALNSITLADNIISIGNSAFKECSSLEDLPIENITKFGSNCFLGTGIKNVEIADGVTNIPWMCFGQCSNLTSVVIPKSVSSINETAFYDIMDRITIYCYYDSFAYRYAKEKNRDYILLDEVMLGDADGDGVVNINDVTAIQRHVAEFKALDDLQAKAADVNGDGSVTIEDATILQQYLAEYELSYPINQSIRADYSQRQDGI